MRIEAGPLNDDCSFPDGPHIADGHPILSSMPQLATLTDTSIFALIGCEGYDADGPGYWYSFYGTGATMTASVCQSTGDFPVQLSVFVGDPCFSALCLDANVVATNETCLSISWSSDLSRLYYVKVQAVGDVSKDSSLVADLRVTSTIADICSGARGPVVPTSFGGAAAVVGALSDLTDSTESPPDCGLNISSPGAWYQVVGTGGEMVVNTCVPVSDDVTHVSLYRGSCSELECVEVPFDLQECSDVYWFSDAGEMYYIFVQSNGTETATFGLEVSAYNEVCDESNPIPSDGTLIWAETSDSYFNSFSGVCGENLQAPSAWYTVLGTGGNLTVSTCNSDFDVETRLTIFEGSCESLECTASVKDDSCWPSTSVTFSSVSGVQYYILVQDELLYNTIEAERRPFALSVSDV